MPQPSGRDLQVEVRAISVNPVDYKQRMRSTPNEQLPIVLGWDVAGVVRAVGPDATLFRPGDPEGDVIVVTDLEDADQFPAQDILDAYLLRWEVENCFQQITEVFTLRRLISSTPEATVYQAMFCLLLYNVLIVVRGYVAEAARRKAEEVSLEELFTDAQRQLIAWNEVVSVAETVQLLRGYPVTALPARLRQLAAGRWKDRWQKTKGSSKSGQRPKKRPKEYLEGGHTSVYRLLQRARQAIKHAKSP